MQPTYSGVVHGCSFDRSRGYDALVNISAAERVGHYPHPRPVVERNDKEVRVLPKTNHRWPRKDIVATRTDKKGDLKRGTNDGY